MRNQIPVQDQIAELNKKLQLHEGDLKGKVEYLVTIIKVIRFFAPFKVTRFSVNLF